MRAGQLSDYKAKVIEAQTADLSDADAAKADAILAAAGAAGAEGTAGQLQVKAMTNFLFGRATPAPSAHEDTHPAADGRGCA